MPTVDQIDAEHTQVQVSRNCRYVASGQHQVIVDVIPEREPYTQVVELFTRLTSNR